MTGELEMNDWYTGRSLTSSTPDSEAMHIVSSKSDSTNTARSAGYISILINTPKSKC